MIGAALWAAARQCSVARVPFVVDGRRVGSVAVADVPALQALRHVDHALRFDAAAVELRTPATERNAVLAVMHAQLREQGHIRAWRDEIYALRDPATLEPLALIERAAARFWGLLTFGAHATGYVANADGRPSQLWIARRAPHKATDPGLLDNLIGAGVPHDQTPRQALLREAWEEAGLTPAQAEAAVAVGKIELHRDVAEGLQHEWLYSFDLALPVGLLPNNQDGEVAGFELMPPQRVLPLLAAQTMTLDAALVSFDFLVRHQLVDEAERAERVGRDNTRPADGIGHGSFTQREPHTWG